MTELLTLLSSGQTATTTAQGGNDIVSILTMLIPLALMVVIFYFLIIRPEKKRGKKMQEIRQPLLRNIALEKRGICKIKLIPIMLYKKREPLVCTFNLLWYIPVRKSILPRQHEAVSNKSHTKQDYSLNEKSIYNVSHFQHPPHLNILFTTPLGAIRYKYNSNYVKKYLSSQPITKKF